MFIDSVVKTTGSDWAQEFSLFDDGAVNTERAIEENIDALATAKRVMWTFCSPARIKERKYSTSVIDSIIGIQGFIHTLVKPEESVEYLDIINPINDHTKHSIQLNFTLKTQDWLVDVLVQTVSGVIQGVAALFKKDNK